MPHQPRLIPEIPAFYFIKVTSNEKGSISETPHLKPDKPFSPSNTQNKLHVIK